MLWIFGHVHDYQRRSRLGPDEQPVAPVLVVAGGGGASPLDSQPLGFQWQPSDWAMPFSRPYYNQVHILVTAARIAVEVRGREKPTEPFRLIDSFVLPNPPLNEVVPADHACSRGDVGTLCQ